MNTEQEPDSDHEVLEVLRRLARQIEVLERIVTREIRKRSDEDAEHKHKDLEWRRSRRKTVEQRLEVVKEHLLDDGASSRLLGFLTYSDAHRILFGDVPEHWTRRDTGAVVRYARKCFVEIALPSPDPGDLFSETESRSVPLSSLIVDKRSGRPRPSAYAGDLTDDQWEEWIGRQRLKPLDSAAVKQILDACDNNEECHFPDCKDPSPKKGHLAPGIDGVLYDRPYWDNRAPPQMVAIASECVDIINENANPKVELDYKKALIGLTDGVRPHNFVHFWPRRKNTEVWAHVEDLDAWVDQFEDAGVNVAKRGEGVRITIEPEVLNSCRGLIREFLHCALRESQA